MAQSFREIIRNDANLIQLLNLIDESGIDEDGEIRIGDFHGTIKKITTINTINPHEYSRRIAWTLTGKLLLGLTKTYDIQVNLCHDECSQLMKKCSTGIFMEKSQTTKRKTKQVTVKTKNKKMRTTEVEEETTDTEKIHFWEVPLELDKNDITLLPDKTLVPASKVTLREVDKPTVQIFSGIHDSLENGFGDNGLDIFQDKDEEMEPFVSLTPNESLNQMPASQPIELDENMNNVDVEIDQVTVQPESAAPVQEPIVRRNENPLNLLAKVESLQPPAVSALRKRRGKRQNSIFKDIDKMISDEIMKKRTSNALVGCKNRRSNLVVQDKQTKLNDIFLAPVMNGSFNRDLFARGTKIRQTANDWTTIQDAFDYAGNDESSESTTSEVDILRNESENAVIQTRSRSRISDTSPNQPVFTSTPVKDVLSQKSAPSFHAPRSQSNLIDVVDPPFEFQNSSLSLIDQELMPPPNFLNSSNSRFIPINHNRSIPVLNDDVIPDVDLDESPPIQHQDLANLLGENSLDYTIMQKLMKLWKKDIHPIKVEHLLTPHCNRFIAAKTFASLLGFKQKKLVQLENADDGKIAHISIGESLTSIAD